MLTTESFTTKLFDFITSRFYSHHSLAFEVHREKRVVVGELRVPVLTCHTLWSDIHCACVICALPLDAGHCCVDIGVLTVV